MAGWAGVSQMPRWRDASLGIREGNSIPFRADAVDVADGRAERLSHRSVGIGLTETPDRVAMNDDQKRSRR